jgi:predicted CopG family antitoxin
MVKIISISDEVYDELSKMKNGRSFTGLLKDLILECVKKGDPKEILGFLEAEKPISEDSAAKILEATMRARKNAVARKLD